MTTPLDKPAICSLLIGRTHELTALNSLLDPVKSGQGQIALISGEAGIGKSRLVAEVKASALAQDFQLLQGTCFQTDTSYPYAPLLDLLRSFFAHHLPLTADQEPLVHELSRVLPDLALPLSAHTPLPIPAHTPDPQQEKRRLFTVLTRFFTHQATRQPALLIIEDLHWCDESSLEFLLHLARQGRSQPIFFLFTYRSDEISPALRHWLAQLDRERFAQEFELLHLSRTEVDAMLQAILAAPHHRHADLLDPIYTLTEGNPFFVEELLTSLIATGEVRYADGTWERTAQTGDARGLAHIPRSVQDAVQQRTEGLSGPARQVLTLAAVAGRRFDFALLQQVMQCEEEHLLPLIKELIAAQLVVEESADRFAFRHALIREALYAELLVRERRSMHRTIAETLESLAISPLLHEAYLADIAHHFYEAGAWSKALEYGQRMGEKALALYAPRAASEHFTRALDAAHQLKLPPPAHIYYGRGQAYETLGAFDHARGDYEHALDTAQDVSLEWQSMMALGLLWAERDYAQTGAWFRRGVELAERLADPILRARSLNRLGNWLGNTGRTEEGLQAHQEALSIFEAQHNIQGMAETLDLLGITYGMRGDRINAVEQLGQAIALFRSLGDMQSLVSSLAMRAVQSMPGSSETTFCPPRTRDECVQDAEESLRLARQIESLAGQAFAENALAHTLLSFGEFSPALSHAQEASRIATEIEHQQWMVATSYALGHTYVLLLAPAQAITALEAGLSLAQELGSTFWIATLAAHLGRASILNHDLPAAYATLQAVMPREQHPRTMAEREIALAWGELMLAQGEPGMALQMAEHLLASTPGKVQGQSTQPIPHLLKLKGEALMTLSHLDEAVEALEDARWGAVARNARPVLWTVHRSLGQAYQLLQRKEQARQERAAARQLIEELATTIDDASLRAQFERAALDSFPKEKPPLPREAARHAFGGLTAREREVAALIAQGKTSREIADLLVVSERTAEGHVSNILGKLGFTSRAQIAVWVVERGLAKR
jgi:DNA-binding NarL/FixJ family response regulator